ncbi:extracellular solute-binding protein [Kroppenstedtia eburnea]|uniref:Iron(III) transport system substrate-binding protein n=1 Tax=Kroppenstedtia eburnea TaxID=714067 RepID=A0A1N7J6C2_9BACL|nr:extracellular solute-binding protein [Kroppenstedtia eburnea]EGK13093.1 AfuA protein [Desmospora sp. 8437]QKI82548.1 extracellular solute-binding protein [Kroppenstedtia eburnea]SIS44859.1 iron(III) transport system substrate-binding protein [Kroppenstedtia eburnea]
MNKGRWWSLVGIPILVSVIGLVGCAGGGAGAGGAEGNITLYSPETPDMSKEIGQAYEKANPGSKVDVQYGGTNVIVNRLIAEKDRPMGDLWYGGGGFLPFETAKGKGIVTAYKPDFAKDWPVEKNGIKVRDEDWKWVGTEVFVLGFIYNTDKVKKDEVPRTWDDLLDPRWKGKLQMPNPAASGTATLTVMSRMMEMGEEKGWQYFDKLVDQANAFPDSGLAPSQAVAKGEAEIGVAFDFMAYEMKARGEKVDFVVPEKTPILVNPVTLVKDGPNPEGGKAMIDYLLSKEGQEVLAKWYHIPIREDVKSQTPLTLKKVMPHAQKLDVDWAVNNYDRIRNEWRKKFE